MKGELEDGNLDRILSQSEFKKQVDALGSDVFSMLLDLHEEGKINSYLMSLFPREKLDEFNRVSSELLGLGSKVISFFRNYLDSSNELAVRETVGKEYENIMPKRDKVLKILGYDALYKGFINAQSNDSLMESEGDTFFYIREKKFSPKNKNSELIWVFAKTVEFLYETAFR